VVVLYQLCSGSPLRCRIVARLLWFGSQAICSGCLADTLCSRGRATLPSAVGRSLKAATPAAPNALGEGTMAERGIACAWRAARCRRLAQRFCVVFSASSRSGTCDVSRRLVGRLSSRRRWLRSARGNGSRTDARRRWASPLIYSLPTCFCQRRQRRRR